MNNETPESIFAEMRTYFQMQKRNGNPEHRPWHQVLSDWADRLEAAEERERGALVAEAEAAKDARNRALVRLREEYAKRCHECKTKSGNATAMRLCDELIQAAYDADICSPGDLAHRVRKIKDAIGPSPQGNAAKLREARAREQATAEIIVRPSPSADTRSADHIITESELRASTEMHILDVRRGMEWIARRLAEAGKRHDWTKIQFFDEFYRQFSEAQKTGEWGKGWYDEIHIKKERHHLNEEVPPDITLLDVLEMIVDCVVAGKARTGKFIPGELDAENLKLAYANTQKTIADAVRVSAPFDEAAFDEAVSKPNGWCDVEDPVAEIRRMRDGDAPGNAAAMREALMKCYQLAYEWEGNEREGIAGMEAPDSTETLLEIQGITNAALAAPPRNCDIGTADEQAERFEAECQRHGHCTPCPVHANWGEFVQGKPKSCALIWGQMPFAPAEGGAE